MRLGLLVLLSDFYFAYGIQVTIKNGPVIGRKESTILKNMTFYSFRGIPYAQPPVGNLRFSQPVPPEDWKEPFNATEDGNVCTQNPLLGVEDCLNINVYSPTDNSSASLPVMVYIYGGMFLFGDAKYDSYGPDFLVEQDVIVVTFNYRMGIFGFLSTEDMAASGNWGLKDQILALKWVQENIKIFGGNPGSVTLFGQSAGSASVSYLTQTSLTKNLFHRVILESGTSLNLFALSRHAREAAFAVGKILGISTANSSVLISELRKVNAGILSAVSLFDDIVDTFMSNPRDGLIYSPNIENDGEGAVITGKSHERLSQGEFHKVPYMIGFNSMEGIHFVEMFDYIRLFLISYDLNPKKMIPIDMNIDTADIWKKSIVSLLIKKHYFCTLPVVLSEIELTKFVTDDQLVRPIYETVNLMSNFTPVYYYRFSYEGELGKQTRKMQGVDHGEEIFYLWRVSKALRNPPEKDLLLRNRLVKLWTNFAKYSDPTPNRDQLLENISWAPVESSNISYLDIGEHFEINNQFINYSISVWKQLYDKYGTPPYDTF